MKYALTLWQPWAGIVAVGIKLVENRPWPAPAVVLGERIYIHAGKRYDRTVEDEIVNELGHELPGECHLMGAIIATARVVVCAGGAAGIHPEQQRWFFGPYGWILADVELVDPPIPCRGFQRLWRPSAVADVLRERGLEE